MALIDAGVALARAGGPDKVVLREAARIAGVSHSAAYRHFTDREALLSEVAHCARGELAAQMLRGADRAADPVSRLGAVGTAYVDFALNNPGLFRTAFIAHPSPVRDNHDPHRSDAPESPRPGVEPFEVLEQVLDEVQSAGMLDPHRRPGAAIAAWSAVHGLAGLLVDGPLPSARPEVDLALSQVLELIARGLLRLPGQSADAPDRHTQSHE
ncbi:TetR/AcrR family transcriptional regulator [Nocardia sp.]|uniref:TetR/AcrR family transcriptional regulator n=1 Tax=Nocardia sp. TaxID=1821 RepID=UPI00260A1482|nr:TetR/AcrR family transcriptional regulator [Nocardia sp.]